MSLDPSADLLDLAQHMQFIGRVFDSFLEIGQGRVNRLGCVVSRAASSENPANDLARRFCNERWTTTGRPLDGLLNCELHATKRLNLETNLKVNNSMRLKTVTISNAGQPPGSVPNAVLIEHDINTLNEDLNLVVFSRDSVRRFFESLPTMFTEMLDAYFVGDEQ